MAVLCGCPQQQPPASTAANPAKPVQRAPVADAEDSSEALPPAQMQAPKQLVLVYTGNTHARLLPAGKAEFDNLTGGLPALAAEVAAVEQEIVQYNRMRVANDGGDPSLVRVDLDAGMIGDHPFMLLDYGGWYSPDLLKVPGHTALMLEAMTQMRYSAVALRDWQLLTPEELALVAGMSPLPPLVNSPGDQPAGLPSVQRVLLREVLGSQWGVASLPRLPELDRELYGKYISALLDDCAMELELSGAQFRILLAADQTPELYRALATDTRFNVVIGAPAAMSALAGFGEITGERPLMLPHINEGGTELARCHLIWDNESSGPVNYFFERREVHDDGSDFLPWRKRIKGIIQSY